MITYHKLLEKFIDKGYISEFHFFILPPPWFIPGKTLGTQEEQFKCYVNAVELTYGKEWDYWNTWIDYQRHK